ncbi:hypothetical protein [Salinactinospora qingdaonensis]|uniref:Uncharacterized protein n=1 Tax=Salinactinospora qingdaonensis TaxID=702744 RepID=A0ABP7F052_9ACTN
MGGRRGWIVALVVLVGGVAVGLASLGADRVPSTARESGLDHHTLPALLYFALVTLVDTYLGWCVIPVLLGYGAVRSPGRAAATGATFALVALTAYTVARHIALVHDAQKLAALDLPPSPTQVPDPSVLDTAVGVVLSPLLVVAVAGAVLGALAGYHARRLPFLLLVLAAAVAVDLWRRTNTPWLSIANGVPNVLLVAAGIVALAWTVVATLRMHRGSSTASSGAPRHP